MPKDALHTPTNLPVSSPEDTAVTAALYISLHGHGPDSTTATCLPPALTPATTHRQSVSLGALSNFWSSSEPNPPSTSNLSFNPLTTSTTSSNPPLLDNSTTNTINTTTASSLHHSAALRALNAGSNRHTRTRHPSKASSTNTSLSSQPVVVRTYSGTRSRPSSGLYSPRLAPGPYTSMNGHAASPHPAARLPAVDDFSFSGILRAVDPEIRGAIDAIAEICARSRLSLADEYDAHLPPQGEIVNAGAGTGYVGLMGRARAHGQGRVGGSGWGEHALTAVPEASSSSERLAGESRGSTQAGSVSAGGKEDGRSAYGSLKSVMGSGKRGREDFSAAKTAEGAVEGQCGGMGMTGAAQREPDAMQTAPHWAVTHEATPHPSITLATPPTASKQLSLVVSASAEEPDALVMKSTQAQVLHRRHTSLNSVSQTRPRSGTLSSLASWIPWNRAAAERPSTAAGTQNDATKAEAKLKDLLRASETGQGQERDKVDVVLD